MSYFSQFSYLSYPSFEDPTKSVFVKNILERVVLHVNPFDDRRVYYDYTIKDGDTPQTIATRYYGSVEYYWTIMLVNNIFDYNWDWPLNEKEFNSYIVDKYGSTSAAATSYLYYIKSNKDESQFVQVPQNLYDLTSEYTEGILTKYRLSKYDYENNLNEAKRKIKVIRKEYINEFVDLFNSKL
jgi:Base plate wedge protein 53